MRPRRAGARGFTILELLLALGIIALATLLVFPDLNPTLQKSRGQAALRKTAAFLDDIRRQAVSRRATMVVTVDGDADNALLVRREGRAEGSETYRIPAGAALLSMEPDEGRYFPMGHSNGFVLTIQTGSGRLYRLEIGSFTGLARISEPG